MRFLPLLAASILTAAVAVPGAPFALGAEKTAAKNAAPAADIAAASDSRPAAADIAANNPALSLAQATGAPPKVVEAPPPPGPPPGPPPRALDAAVNVRPSGPPISLEIGKGTLIRLPRPAATVFVADPGIADVQVKSPALIYITAKAPGETVIYAVDDKDEVLLSAPVRVNLDLSRLRESLRETIPGERVSAQSVEGRLVLSGTVSSAARAQKAEAMAASILGANRAGNLVNDMSIATPNQVNLHVRIAEVQRSVLKQLGINWSKFAGNFQFNTLNPTTGLPNVIGALVTNTVAGSLKLPGSTDRLTVTLDALAQEGLITTLAEPNLTAMNGQTASFLVGGEFPVPTNVTVATSGGVPTISVAYKPFGVRLEFTPTILDSHHLNLKVRPEVSELSSVGAVSIEGIVIPALTVRRAETTVELGSGESFALAGLLAHNTTQDMSKIPGLGDIPILGQLFRSNQFAKNESELVIIVTPYLVNPVATASLATPMDGYEAAHDYSQVITNDMYRQKLPGPAIGPLPAGGRGLIGPGGFRLD